MNTSAEIVKGLYDSFAKGDVPAVLGTLDPNIEWREADNSPYADHNPYIGPAAIAEGVFHRVVTDIENFTVSPRHIIGGSDIIVVEGRYTGTIRSTGRRLNAQFAHVWELRNDKIVRFQQYTDTRQWADAAGF